MFKAAVIAPTVLLHLLNHCSFSELRTSPAREFLTDSGKMLSSCSRVWRVSTLRPRPLALAPSRGKKKKSSRKSSAPTDVTPEIASLLDLSKYESSMRKTMEALHSDLSKLRSSGAAPGMLDGS